MKFGYLDKEYALDVLKVRNVHEIVSRLRKDGWPIETQHDNIERLYVLRFDRRAYVRRKAFGIALAAMDGDTSKVKGLAADIKRLVTYVGL
ncbi:hypothetical protein BFS86_09220 [Shewanella algae]|nr:hypothetical protein BFS86_09220 [Shewanella algae]